MPGKVIVPAALSPAKVPALVGVDGQALVVDAG